MIHTLLQNILWEKNCSSDREKCFRLKAENLQKIRDHFLEKLPIGTKNWDAETYGNKLENIFS